MSNKFPMMAKVPYGPPEPDEYFDNYFQTEQNGPWSTGASQMLPTPSRANLKPPKTAVLQVLPSGETFDDGGLMKFDYRSSAENNERVVVTRQRALHDTDFDAEDTSVVMMKKLTKRVDDPLADPDVLEALGWLMRLETRDPGLRLLGINRRVMGCIALFYRDTGGRNWAPRKWPHIDPETKEKTLPGLEVNPVGTIFGLRLPENNLVGVIPRDFTKGVQNLRELNLHGNPGLGGALPGTIGNLPFCTRLDLSFCGFEGALPPQLCLLLQLKELNLNNCGFTGDLNPRLVDCKKLERLSLSNNRFAGELPRSWGRLARLKTFLLKNNRVKGTIPDEWGELGALEEIDVRNNHLGGPVPGALLVLLQRSPSSTPNSNAGPLRGANRNDPASRPGTAVEGSADSSNGCGGQGGPSGEDTPAPGPRLKVIRIRGNDWTATIPRWPDGILLNRCTDLGLVDLPGTPYMTSRDAARRLMHGVSTSGDVEARDYGTVTGGADALMSRRFRPPTAHSPRVVAQSTNRYDVKVGGEKVFSGLATLQLLPAPVPCETCKGRYPVCMCVSVCRGCGKFNRLSRVREARAGGSGGGEGGVCRWCALSEESAVKFRAAVTAGNRGATARARRSHLSSSSASGPPSVTAPRGRDARTLGQALLFPPKPLDLLSPLTSQATDSDDPYADNFPF